jgi:crossover junction endodeoxyribonuclease RuvC
MIVLGVDPGGYRTGWGVVERRGNKLAGLAAGVIECKKSAPLPERLLQIHTELTRLFEEFEPSCVAVEDLFLGEHATAALKLGQARGVVLLAAAQRDLPVSEYPPAVIKRSVGGSGRAPKEQVAHMVGAILGWKQLPPVDATDALAIAITHAQTAGR